MDMAIFREAISLACAYDDGIAIGGGEPTLHPQIIDMIGLASMMSSEPVFMVTNGTCDREIWRILMRAMKNDRLSLYVSKDIWHDASRIKPWVWDDAEKHKMWWGDPHQVASRTIVRQGRARKNIAKLKWEAESSYQEVRVVDSDCSGPMVFPDGSVWADVPKRRRFGDLCEDSLQDAFDAIRKHEDG